MRITDYSFGKICVDGKVYTKDLIILPSRGGIIENWWRRKGHEICAEDLKELVGKGIQKIIFGTGKFGMVKIKDSAKKLLDSEGIAYEAFPTAKAVEEYNKSQESLTAGAFHLTC